MRARGGQYLPCCGACARGGDRPRAAAGGPPLLLLPSPPLTPPLPLPPLPLLSLPSAVQPGRVCRQRAASDAAAALPPTTNGTEAEAHGGRTRRSYAHLALQPHHHPQWWERWKSYGRVGSGLHARADGPGSGQGPSRAAGGRESREHRQQGPCTCHRAAGCHNSHQTRLRRNVMMPARMSTDGTRSASPGGSARRA